MASKGTELGKKREAKIQAAMAELTFGVELETEGRSIRTIAEAIAAELLTTPPKHIGGHYDKWTIQLADGREWTCMSDGSLLNGGCEIVSPICKLVDMEMVQAVVRAARNAGATVSSRCGMHVHIGGLDAPAVARLAKNVAKDEDLFVEAFQVQGARLNHYCKRVNGDFLNRLNQVKANTITKEKLACIWYNDDAANSNYRARAHYDGSRYHGLNLHSFFYRGTVEFRYFEGTLHAGVVRANITFALGLAAQAVGTAHCYAVAPSAKSSLRNRMQLLISRWGLKDKVVLEHLRKHLPKAPKTAASVAQAQATGS